MNYQKTVDRHIRRAREIMETLDIEGAWKSVGARVNLVGSVKSGLIVNHRDIDFHIYTKRMDVAESFGVVSKIAAKPGITDVQYGNLLDTEEECIEWHAGYTCPDGEKWRIDMIHIREGSLYDGAVEKVTDGVIRLLTPETREAILRIKAEAPVKVVGVDVYRAVFTAGIRTYEEYEKWIKENPPVGVFGWMP